MVAGIIGCAWTVLQYAILFSITLEMYKQTEVAFCSALFSCSVDSCVQIHVENGNVLQWTVSFASGWKVVLYVIVKVVDNRFISYYQISMNYLVILLNT